MPISRWYLACAAAVASQIFVLGSLAFEIAQPWNGVWHLLAYSGLTLLLWIATDGRFPVLAVAAVMLFATAGELRQAWIPGRTADALGLLVDLCAAVVTAATLMWLTKVEKRACAESSQR